VFAVADVITVMADGAVLASGAPETVRIDPAVREAYLGDAEFSPLAPLAGRGSG
jgi:branched-chain amino acid transport system ATP-binding protein